ncbi:MAG: hypothetical protein P4L53_20650 [Candidatus Obscuribacterales bacterium]|nr:hypothetical protein [Candidatus Obscuribacterales bacterium]
MDFKALSEKAEQGHGCDVLVESQKGQAATVDAYELLFQSYAKIVDQSREHPTLREPNGLPTARLNAFVDFNVTPGVDKVSLVNEHDADVSANRELSWMLINQKTHKVTRVGCSEGPLEHQK